MAGASTERETVEIALDLVAFRKELRREIGAVLISANTRDLSRIAKVFAFDFVAPYPDIALL